MRLLLSSLLVTNIYKVASEDLYYYEFDGRQLITAIPPKCHGVRSTIQCCLKMSDEKDIGNIKGELRRLSIDTVRLKTRVMGFMCLKLFIETEGGKIKYVPSYYGPNAIRYSEDQVARLKSVTITGLKDVSTGSLTKFVIGHCIDRDSDALKHTVLGWTIDCLDVPKTKLNSIDRVIYAWFTNDANQPQTAIWAQVRERDLINYEEDDITSSDKIKVQSWGVTTIAWAAIGSDLLLDYEVCIFARKGVDTVINLRLGELGEEDWPVKHKYSNVLARNKQPTRPSTP